MCVCVWVFVQEYTNNPASTKNGTENGIVAVILVQLKSFSTRFGTRTQHTTLVQLSHNSHNSHNSLGSRILPVAFRRNHSASHAHRKYCRPTYFSIQPPPPATPATMGCGVGGSSSSECFGVMPLINICMLSGLYGYTICTITSIV